MNEQTASDFIRTLMVLQSDLRHEEGPADELELGNLSYDTVGSNAQAWLEQSEEDIAHRIELSDDKKQEINDLLSAVTYMMEDQQSVYNDQISKVASYDQIKLNELLQSRLEGIESTLKDPTFLEQFDLFFDHVNDELKHREVKNPISFVAGVTLTTVYTAATVGAVAIGNFNTELNGFNGLTCLFYFAALATTVGFSNFAYITYVDHTRGTRDENSYTQAELEEKVLQQAEEEEAYEENMRNPPESHFV